MQITNSEIWLLQSQTSDIDYWVFTQQYTAGICLILIVLLLLSLLRIYFDLTLNVYSPNFFLSYMKVAIFIFADPFLFTIFFKIE